MQIKLTAEQVQRLLNARKSGNRRDVRRAVFSEVRRQYPAAAKAGKFRVAIEDPANPLYAVIRNKYNGLPIDDGVPAAVLTTGTVDTAPAAAPAAPAATIATGASPVAAVAGAVAAVADKKAKAVKAKPVTPFKTAAAKPATKKAAPAKKAAAKAPAKKAAAKAVLADVKPKVKKTAKGAHSPTKTDTCQIECRVTINGVRQRLGWVSTEEMKAKIIADAKKAAGVK